MEAGRTEISPPLRQVKPVGDREEGGTWDDDQPKGDPWVTGLVGPALGQIVPAAVDALAAAEEIGVAGAKGFCKVRPTSSTVVQTLFLG